MSIATWKLQLYWSQDVVAPPVKLCEPLSGLCVSCRQLRDDEHCWRWPAATTAPSLNCRWYEWKGSESLGPRPGAVSDPEQRFSSSLYLLLTAAVLMLNVLLSCWVKQTSLPSSACDMTIKTVNTNYSTCHLPWMLTVDNSIRAGIKAKELPIVNPLRPQNLLSLIVNIPHKQLSQPFTLTYLHTL